MTMPIITVQRRMAEQGRIRLGYKATGTNRQGKEYTRPAKLEAFRFTSPNARLIDEIAAKYGGTAQPWDNDGKSEHEVLSDATSIPVIVVKGGFSQWHEYWTKAGCQHRCDGEKDVTGAMCDPNDPAHIEAIDKPTTRLSVMLSEIETLGVWRMESKGWNAAAELPSMAELAMHVGDLVPATLSLAERSSVVQVNGRPQTSRYVVPVLDLHVTKRRLVELVGGVGGVPALEGADAPALEEATPDYAGIAATLTNEDALRELWVQAKDAGHLTGQLKAVINQRVAELSYAPNLHAVPDDDAPGDVDEPIDGEVVDDNEDRAAVWQQILTAAGRRDFTQSDVQTLVEGHTALPIAECSADQLREVLQILTTGEVVSA